MKETPPPADAVMVHVLFMDIVGASKRFTDDQPRMVKDLQTKVSQTLEYQRAHGCNQLVAIATGDGMALVFLDKIESPIRCSLELSRALRAEESYKVRMGIHSGPVFIVEDINGQRNVSGAGINRAQRVMDCGDGDHILLSDTIAESLRQFREWNQIMKDIGDCKVKDGWQHVWLCSDGTFGNQVLPKKAKRYLAQRRRNLLLGLTAAVILLAAVAAWFLIPRSPAAQTSLTYSVIVRKPNNETLTMAKEMAFPAGYAIKLRFQSVEHGFLYLINEGPTHNWSWMFSGEVAAAQTVTVPEAEKTFFQFDEKSGIETVYVVWSAKAMPQLHTTSPALEAQAFLETKTPPVVAVSEGGSTQLTARGTYLVRKIVLEHM